MALKTLLIIRHAKSSWNTGSLNDFERPLNERGKKDAPIMAQKLIEAGINIDAFISSPAKRAKKTAELFCEEYKRKETDIIFVSALYHATVQTFYQTIENIDDAFATIALFSHNPGITSFVNELTDSVTIGNMPTCGVFAVKINIEKWKGFAKSPKEFFFFDYPKA